MPHSRIMSDRQNDAVQWTERDYIIVAEINNAGCLEFWERDAWEVRYYRAASTRSRLAKARALFRQAKNNG